MRLVTLLLVSLLVPLVSAQYSGAVDPRNPQLVFNVPIESGQLLAIKPVIEPSEPGEFTLRVEKEPGYVILEGKAWIASSSYKSDSEQLDMEFSPVKMNGSVRVAVSGYVPADVRLDIVSQNASDGSLVGDADGSSLSMTPLVNGTIGHIAGSLERRFIRSSNYVDESDWYILPAPGRGNKTVIELSPRPRGYFLISVYTPDGKKIFNQSSAYPFERLDFVIESKEISQFFVEVGAANQTGGGFYMLTSEERGKDESLNTTVFAREVQITPLSFVQGDGGISRFWHVLLIGILGMMVVAMLSAYHFGNRLPRIRSARTIQEYIKHATAAGYTRDSIEQAMRQSGYTDQMIRDGFSKVR